MIPWNLKEACHWVLIVIHLRKRYISILDSGAAKHQTFDYLSSNILRHLLQSIFLIGSGTLANNEKTKNEFQTYIKSFVVIKPDPDYFPTHSDGISCGVFLLAAIKSILDEQHIKKNFSHKSA